VKSVLAKALTLSGYCLLQRRVWYQPEDLHKWQVTFKDGKYLSYEEWYNVVA